METSKLIQPDPDLSTCQFMVDHSFRGMKDQCAPGKPVGVWEVGSPKTPEQVTRLGILYIPKNVEPFLPTNKNEIDVDVRVHPKGESALLEIDLLDTDEPTIRLEINSLNAYLQAYKTVIYFVDEEKKLKGMLYIMRPQN